MMKVIDKVEGDFPLRWVNLDYLPESNGIRNEIYLKQPENIEEELILLFYQLFGASRDKILLYNDSWWDFCLDTWNSDKDEYDYEIEGKSNESVHYIKMLSDSEIEIGYSGLCKCIEWDKCLWILLRCIVSHQAPYSPIFYNEECNYFFYFHYSGSIGFYFQEYNEVVKRIIQIANEEFEIHA